MKWWNELDEEQKNDFREARSNVWWLWKMSFVIQLVIGSHSMYEYYPQWSDMSFLLYTLVLLTGAAIAATVILVFIFIVLFIAGAAVLGFEIWKEKRREKAENK